MDADFLFYAAIVTANFSDIKLIISKKLASGKLDTPVREDIYQYIVNG